MLSLYPGYRSQRYWDTKKNVNTQVLLSFPQFSTIRPHLDHTLCPLVIFLCDCPPFLKPFIKNTEICLIIQASFPKEVYSVMKNLYNQLIFFSFVNLSSIIAPSAMNLVTGEENPLLLTYNFQHTNKGQNIVLKSYAVCAKWMSGEKIVRLVPCRNTIFEKLFGWHRRA